MEGFVLVMGRQDVQGKLAENYQMKKYITTNEFCALFPEITYYVRYEYPNKKRLEFEKKRFFKRYGFEFPDVDSQEYELFR